MLFVARNALAGRATPSQTCVFALEKFLIHHRGSTYEAFSQKVQSLAMSDELATKSAKKRILLVDDDPEIVESLRYALESKGYEILVARDGNQGLALVEREDPDLVILDMMMPKRSGFLVLEKLRRTRPVPVRIIMITANEGSRHKAYAEMLGVDDYIRKPFPMDRLVDSVARLLTSP